MEVTEGAAKQKGDVGRDARLQQLLAMWHAHVQQGRRAEPCGSGQVAGEAWELYRPVDDADADAGQPYDEQLG